MAFPLSFVPRESWHERPRSFGAPRDRGRRKHAGCDLYAPVGTPVYAVEDGKVRQFGLFYRGTYALVVEHDGFVVRYGEIKKDIAMSLAAGSRVRKGQKIGLVGKLTGLDISMIHFEMYSGAAGGPLTVGNRPPFMRRSDLIDPTTRLDGWAQEPLPGEGA